MALGDSSDDSKSRQPGIYGLPPSLSFPDHRNFHIGLMGRWLREGHMSGYGVSCKAAAARTLRSRLRTPGSRLLVVVEDCVSMIAS